MFTKKLKNKEVISYLQSCKNEILNYLIKIVNSKNFNYRTFGTDIEEYLNNILIQIFTEGKIIEDNNDYFLAPNKNYFPDFELKTKQSLAIEYKSGNKSQYRKDEWVTVKNSENDMGTLNEWPNKIKKFGGENIYYIFVTYNFNDTIKEILDIEIAPFYNFLGVNSDGVLKYREKDGNLRPKDFDAEPPLKTFKQFEQLFNKSIIYRSKRIIKKHRLIVKEASRKI